MLVVLFFSFYYFLYFHFFCLWQSISFAFLLEHTGLFIILPSALLFQVWRSNWILTQPRGFIGHCEPTWGS